MKILVACLVLLSGCTTLNTTLTPDQLAAADYGRVPEQENVVKEVRAYLKGAGYFDPYGAQIEECTNYKQGYRYQGHSYDTPSEPIYNFGYELTCDINNKNRMGGFTGFQNYRYFYSNGKILEGDIPSRPDMMQSLIFGS